MSYTIAQIKQIQTVLRKGGFYTRSIDGIWGPYSISATKAYQKKNGLVVDGIVGPITLKKMGISFNTPTKTYNSDKTLFSKSMATAIGHKFDTLKESLTMAKGLGYKEYYNDVYDQSNAVKRLAKRLGINCSDACQLWYQLAKDLGYSVRYVHVKCASGTGHIQLDIKNKEYGPDWVRIDPAAILKGNVSLWCKGAKVIGYDEAWLRSDDGKT